MSSLEKCQNFTKTSTPQVNCGKELIKAGADANVKNIFQQTALTLAVSEGNVAFLKVLISVGADVNTLGRDGSSPLIMAAMNGHVNCGKELIDAGANMNIKNKLHQTAMKCVAFHGHDSFLKMLISEGANVNIDESSLLVPGTDELHNFLPNTLSLAETTLTALISGKELPDSVKQLTDTEANINIANEDQIGNSVLPNNMLGASPLILAAYGGHVECAEMLIEAGADVNYRDTDQSGTALSFCSIHKKPGSCKEANCSRS